MTERQQYLLGAIALAQFTPRRDDAPLLVAMAKGAPKPLLQQLARALARLPHEAVATALASGLAGAASDREAREATCELARRLPANHAAAAIATLAAALHDVDVAVRKTAMRGLSNHDDADAVAALVALAKRDGLDPDEVALLVRALAKVGAAAALTHLQQRFPGINMGSADVIAARHLVRGEEVAIDAGYEFSSGQLIAECRDGIAPIAAQQYAAAKVVTTGVGTHHVLLQSPLSLKAALSCRSAVRVGLVLHKGKPPKVDGAGLAQIVAVVANAHALIRAVTKGPIRYRLAWPGATTSARHEVAAAVSAIHADMTNDPRGAAWQISYSAPHWLAWPSALTDTRFAWRQGDIPAASHPTVAAALAYLAQPTGKDRIWDPFCGSGSELIECGLLAPNATLIGSDVSGAALAVARGNVEAAGLTARASLSAADALSHWPEATLVISNPPHGGRVKADAVALHEAVFSHVATHLPPGGRLVWIRHANATVVSARLRRGAHFAMTLAGQAMVLERWDCPG